MSYDLAVWKGDRPADDVAAREQYLHLYDRYIRSQQLLPPTPRIATYAGALLRRYPDIDSEIGEDSPWADAPLVGDASGPLIYFGIVYSQCDEVSAWASQLAAEHGLVCYDPQLDKLRPWAFPPALSAAATSVAFPQVPFASLTTNACLWPALSA